MAPSRRRPRVRPRPAPSFPYNLRPRPGRTLVSTVQDFADRFQALACHASGVTAQQRADLFVGGLPDHIRVDVELRGPQDLQTAMYYARAFECRAVAIQQDSPFWAAGSLP